MPADVYDYYQQAADKDERTLNKYLALVVRAAHKAATTATTANGTAAPASETPVA